MKNTPQFDKTLNITAISLSHSAIHGSVRNMGYDRTGNRAVHHYGQYVNPLADARNQESEAILRLLISGGKIWSIQMDCRAKPTDSVIPRNPPMGLPSYAIYHHSMGKFLRFLTGRKHRNMSPNSRGGFAGYYMANKSASDNIHNSIPLIINDLSYQILSGRCLGMALDDPDCWNQSIQ